MAELAAIGLASNIAQFVELGVKLTKRILEFADDTAEAPKSIRHLFDRLPLILHVVNHFGRWDGNDSLPDTTKVSLLSIVIESRQCAQDLLGILEDLRPRPDSQSLKKAWKAVKSVSKEDSIQKLVSTLDKNIALLSTYQNVANTSAIQNLAKDTSSGFDFLSIDIATGFKHVLSDLQRTTILDWIGQDKSGEYHEIHRTARIAGTCGWILNRKSFVDWQNPTSMQPGGNYLWIHGSSGMGKTFLAARIFEDLLKSHKGRVLAYFCRHENKGNFSTDILRSLLSRMIIADNTNIALELAYPIFKNRKSRIANYDELWDMFQAIVTDVDEYIFVIDGLDEYIRSEVEALPETNSAFAETLIPSFLQRLVQATASASCRVLIVSRDFKEIRSVLGRPENFQTAKVFEYDIRESDLQADALLLAQHIVNTRLPKQDLVLREELAQSIAQKSAGQMLWVRLQEQSLKPSYKDKKLRQLVQNMPVGLRDTYDKQVIAMMRLPPTDRDRAWRLLRWVLFAREPPTIHLLTEAMLIDTSSPSETFPDDDLPRDINEEDVSDGIKQLCQFIDFRRSSLDQQQRHWVVAFPHASRKEHLLDIDDDYHVPELRELRFADRILQESILTRTCLHFLDLTNVWSSPEDGSTNLQEVIDQRPFLRYAILQWPYHATYGISEEVCCTTVAKFCASDNTTWSRWRDGFEKLTEMPGQQEEPQIEAGNRMYYACAFGFTDLIQQLLGDSEDPTKPCGRKGSPMHAAMEHGNTETIKLLLHHARDLNVRNFRGQTLMHCMIMSAQNTQGLVASASQQDGLPGNIIRRVSSIPPSPNQCGEIISILLDGGLDPNATDKAGWTSVNKAAAEGQLKVVELLIERGANISVPNDNGSTPFWSAANGGHEEVVELLMQHGADVSQPDTEGVSPVYAAAAKGHYKVVERLIGWGADINLAAQYAGTPVLIATYHNRKEVVELLLQSGANVEGSLNCDTSPLVVAANRGFVDIVETLIQYGADLVVGKVAQSPLHQAAFFDHYTTVEVLIKHGADVNSRNKKGWTPVHMAAWRGSKEAVKILLDHGADITLTDTKYGTTPLCRAIREGHYSVVELLLHHGADVACRNHFGWTAIAAAVKQGHLEIVKLLLRHGADVNSYFKNDWKLIHLAACDGYNKVVEFLVQRGADVHSRTDEGWTALHLAALNGHVKVVELFMQHRIDVNSRTNASWTPLHIAAGNGQAKVAELLIRHGAIVNARTEMGREPLFVAVSEGHVEIIELLIRRGADVTTRENSGFPVLCAAAHQGHKPIVELLLRSGADIDEAVDGGDTPLCIAAKSGHREVVQCLLSKGANFDLHRGFHTSSLEEGLSCGSEYLVEVLIGKGRGLQMATFRSIGTALATSLDRFSSDNIQLLMDLIEKEKWYSDAIQELMCFAMEKNLDSKVCQKLIDAGASSQLPGPYGWTPVQCSGMSDTLQPNSKQSSLGKVSSPFPVPTGWSPFNNENVLQLVDDRIEIIVQESARDVHLERGMKVYANFFMPADRDTFYFEVTFLAVGPLCIIGIGFSHWDCPVSGMPGWKPGSWGYHGDDGKKFNANGAGDNYGPTYGVGDTIGCGVDFHERSAFFTKNGVHLGTAFTGLTGRLLPTCGFGERGTRLRVNFGDKPFMYEDYVSASSAKRTTAA